MGRMPSTAGGLAQVSLRVSTVQAAWIAKEAKTVGNTNEVVRELIDDAMSLLGLPEAVIEELEKDAASKGLKLSSHQDRRQYLRRVLMRRYDAIVRGEEAKLGEPAPKSRKA